MSSDSERPSAERIASEWRAKGLETLEDVAHLAAKSAEDPGEPSAMPVDFNSVIRETPPELARTIKHPPNEGPVLVDGNKVEKLSDFDGQPLHFIGDREAFAAGMLPAFTSTAAIKQFLGERQTQTFGGSLPMSQAFFEHAGFGGSQKSVAAFNMYADLTRVVRNVFWQNWNDEISSLGACACFITIWEHTWLSGSSVTIAPGGPIEYVGNAWNDRISAIQSWGP